jgi:UDPglucose 6-dehydrogenase
MLGPIERMEHIAVIGTGYVGLVAGALFAANGHSVICADIDKDKIAKLNAGKIPIYEPGLGEIAMRAAKAGNLSFTTDVHAAVRSSSVSFIAVGTPSRKDGSFDIVHILSAAQAIGDALRGQEGYHAVVIKSTIDPEMFGEIERTVRERAGSGPKLSVDIVSNPEFMAEGTAVRDFSKPHRVIVGTTSERARKLMFALYRDFVKIDTHRILFMKPQSAIVAKLASNGVLAARVAFMNEVARYSDAVGADVEEVRAGMSYDPRIGQHFLFPGPGYGGSCFPKDVQALSASARAKRLDLHVIGAVEPSNATHKRYLVGKIERFFGAQGLKGSTIAVWGIAFKARTDDIRDSPAIDVIDALLAHGANVRVHDPEAMGNAKRLWGERIALCETKEAALAGASALVILTEWDEFKSPNYALLAKTLSRKAVFDGRNILDMEEARTAGLTYIAMGRNGSPAT